MSVPVSRTLPYVLRDQLQKTGLARLAVYEVAAVPDPDHVTVVENGTEFTIPRLSGYQPTVGEPVYCIVADTTVVAVGAVGGSVPSYLPKNPTYADIKSGG